MSWPTNPGDWNAMSANMNMNMGTYTPEQWAVVQQQNWQQWNQWQQQYAQWQNQFGDKYAQQLQAIQLGHVPPPPSSGGGQQPPVPPPPDQPPPPPPPHENNQPLYGQAPPVPAVQQRSQNIPNNNSNTGTTQWTSNTDVTQTKHSGNTEALKKLAEEERLFDIQFKKWEEEIDKWRKENVNHPDKQAYKEYEQKFEQCRAQLLERREQMKIKRDRLLNTSSQANIGKAQVTAAVAKNSPSFPSHSTEKSNKNNYNENNTHAFKNSYQQQYDSYNSINKNIDPQDRFESYPNDSNYPPENYLAQMDKSTFLPRSSTTKGIPGLDLVPESTLTSKKQDVIDITDEPKEKSMGGPDYSTISQGINSILGDEKIMNILSMVRGEQALLFGNKAQINSGNQNYPNYNENYQPHNQDNYGSGQQEMYNDRSNNSYGRQEPNQMQQGQAINTHYPPPSGIPQEQYYDQNDQFGGYDNSHMRVNNVGMRSRAPLLQTPEMGQGSPNMRQSGPNIRPDQAQGSHDFRQQGPSQARPDMRQGGLNMRQGLPDMRQAPPDMRQGGHDMRDAGSNMTQGNPDMRQGGQNMRQMNTDMHQGGSNMQFGRPSIQQPGQNIRFDHPNIRQGGPNIRPSGGHIASYNAGPRPLMQSSTIRPEVTPLQDMSRQQNNNDFYNGPDIPMQENSPIPNQPPRPKWVDEPMFAPSIVVEYEHKPLRLKARDFIDPVHTFDYNHKSKNGENKKKDFEKEVEELFTRKPRRQEREDDDERFSRDLYYRDERRTYREDMRPREPTRDVRDRFRDDKDEHWRDRPREDHYERRRDDRYDDRRRDDRDRHRRDDYRRDDRDKDYSRDKTRDYRRDDHRRDDAKNRSRSREKESRRRGLSRDSEISDTSSKKAKIAPVTPENKHIVMIDDILEPPGRDMRPEKIAIILRGPPGSGKSYLAKLIRDREAELGGTVRMMSIDDYFMQEGEVEEKDPVTGKIVKKPTLKYEFDASSEESYLNSLKRAFKRTITDGYFSFLIYDAVNDQLRHYADVWNFARQNAFQVYVCTMELDAAACHRRNVHGRSRQDIDVVCARWFPTPAHHIQLDATTLLQSAAIPDVTMEDVAPADDAEPEVESVFTSRWENMDDAAQLARLDGTSKPLRPSQLSMEDYLQLDEWTPNTAKPGKKTVRWADIEERREQEKMRAIGFVVGQTDWHRMTDPTRGSSALTQTKYIERVRRN